MITISVWHADAPDDQIICESKLPCAPRIGDKLLVELPNWELELVVTEVCWIFKGEVPNLAEGDPVVEFSCIDVVATGTSDEENNQWRSYYREMRSLLTKTP